VNSYLTSAQIPLKVPQLKEEQRILPVFSPEQIKKLVTWKPRGLCPSRLHVLVLLLLDVGCRIGEAFELRWADVDFDNLLLKLHGKGAKDWLVPSSFELRRHLWRWKQINHSDLVFATQGRRMAHRNTLRDVRDLCEDLGIVAPARLLHSFRHTFAVNYIRRGGSVFHLQKVLGHSTLEMTRRCANLVTADLSAVHEKLSLLTCPVAR
jgi:integrase/recombinase XerD